MRARLTDGSEGYGGVRSVARYLDRVESEASQAQGEAQMVGLVVRLVLAVVQVGRQR